MHRFFSLFMLCLVCCGCCAAADSPDPAKSPVLDTFPSGQWMGMNAVFQSQKFDATLDKDRVLRIQPKHDGKNVGVPVLVRFSAYYSNTKISVTRQIVSLEKRPAPAMQPKKVELAGHCEDKVRFSFVIQFSDRGVTVEGDVVDPPKLPYPTVLAYADYFSASHEIPAATPPEEIKRLTEGFTVKFTDAKRHAESLQFWQAVPTRSAVIAVSEVSGQWGPRRVITEMPATPKNGNRVGNFGNYLVSAFYKGGWYFSRGCTDKVPGGPLTVRVE